MTRNFGRLTYDTFKELATRSDLTSIEKIGFPQNYREGHEEAITRDISSKLGLETPGLVVCDIGCGCSPLTHSLVRLCAEKEHHLILIDSEEMLQHLPDAPLIEKVVGRFPDCSSLIQRERHQVDAVLIYSVLQHVILDSNPFTFIDRATCLLKPGGALLLGDLPNISKRKRFFSTPKGIQFHQAYMGTSDLPSVNWLELEEEKIDDSFVFALLQRYRAAGFETYLLPQPSDLPLGNRREDLLIVRT